jgi:KaiC/GvpD/RAD55 family RecA-like ATPase
MVSCLLVVALLTVFQFATPYASSYAQVTSVSGTITLTSTTIVSGSTVYNSLPYKVGGADNHTCQINDVLTFNATKGQEAFVSITTPSSIGFYVMSKGNESTWYSTFSGCTGGGYQIAGTDGTGPAYSTTFTIPDDDEYVLVFVNYQEGPVYPTISVTLGQAAVTTVTTVILSPVTTTNSTSPYTITSPTGGVNSTWILGSIGLIVGVSLFLVVRRRKGPVQRAALQTAARLPPPSAEPSIPTGYQKLDGMLAGGLPEGYAIVIVSQSYDESDLLIRKVLESGVASGRPTFYLSNDIARIRDANSRLGQALYVLSPVADKIASERGNLIKIPDVGDVSNLNISLNQIIESKSGNAASKIIVFDLLSDLLLRNKVITTRRWLSDFIARRKASGFTILATLNPSVASKEDVQTIIGVFDGVIEVFEKPLQERTRRFLVIKKMFGRNYSEDEVMLDRQELLQSDNKR